MIDKFIQELESLLNEKGIENIDITATYRELYDEYVHLGQSGFDIICHFGEPSEIVAEYEKTGVLPTPNMDTRLAFAMPSYLEEKEEVIEEVKKPHENTLPTTKAGLICNDIFFVGLGLLIALAGVIALGTVAILMTASSVVQLGAVWSLPTQGEQVGGFFMALLFLIMSIMFYIIIVWTVKLVVDYMKQYVVDHRETWAKIIATENNNN